MATSGHNQNQQPGRSADNRGGGSSHSTTAQTPASAAAARATAQTTTTTVDPRNHSKSVPNSQNTSKRSINELLLNINSQSNDVESTLSKKRQASSAAVDHAHHTWILVEDEGPNKRKPSTTTSKLSSIEMQANIESKINSSKENLLAYATRATHPSE